MSRLPKDGEMNWGGLLENYLKQSLNHDGTLVSGPKNPHTGGPNTNLANGSQAGLVRLAGDLSHTAANPKVTGLQGNPISLTAPQHGQTLVWNANTGAWEPGGTPGGSSFAQAMAINSMRV